MKVTKRQLRRIIRESLLHEQSAAGVPMTVGDAISRAKGTGGKPHQVAKDIREFQARGVPMEIQAAYLQAYKNEQIKLDQYQDYGDVSGYYAGKAADDIAKKYSVRSR